MKKGSSTEWYVFGRMSATHLSASVFFAADNKTFSGFDVLDLVEDRFRCVVVPRTWLAVCPLAWKYLTHDLRARFPKRAGWWHELMCCFS